MPWNRRSTALAAVGLLATSVLGGGIAIAATDAPAGTVLLVNGSATAAVDQSTAAALASRLGGVVLLVESASLPSATASALDSLDPLRVIVVGGEASVSPAAYEQIRAAADRATVQRVAGRNRFETAAQAAALADAEPVVVGAAGPAGPAGPQGPPGAVGPQGPAGTVAKIAFMGGRACCDSDQTVPAATSTDVAFTQGQYGAFSEGGGFDFATGRFTAPVPGVYDLQTDLTIRGEPGELYQFFIRTPGGDITQEIGEFGVGGEAHVNMSATLSTVHTGGSYWVTAYSPSEMTIDAYRSSFSGHLVYAD